MYVCDANALIRENCSGCLRVLRIGRPVGWSLPLFTWWFKLLCITEQGLAYVDFEDEESLTAAIAKNKEELKGRQVSIARSDPKGGRGGGRGPGANRGGRTGASGRGKSFSNLTWKA